jgi:cephalosporin hydroxylase
MQKIATTSLPTKPIMVASASAHRIPTGCGLMSALYRLVAGDYRAEEDDEHYDHPGEDFHPPVANVKRLLAPSRLKAKLPTEALRSRRPRSCV